MAFLNDRDPNNRAAVPDRVVERRVEERRTVPVSTRVELAPSPARASWSGIWGGFLLAVGIFLVLSALVFAIGASSLNIGAGQPFNLSSIGKGTAIWLYIVMLVALFFGGVFGSRIGMVVDGAIAWFEGSLIWVFGMMAVVLVLGTAAVLAASASPTVRRTAFEGSQIYADLTSHDVRNLQARLQDPKTADALVTATGLSRDQVMTSLDTIRGRVDADAGDAAQASADVRQGLDSLAHQAAATGASPVQRAASGMRTGAWLTFFGMIVAWIVTVLGSFWGRAAARGRAVELGMLRAA